MVRQKKTAVLALPTLRASADMETLKKILPCVEEMGATAFTANWIAMMALERGLFALQADKASINRKVHRAFRLFVKLGLIGPSGAYGFYLADVVRVRAEMAAGDPVLREVRHILEEGFRGGRVGLREALGKATLLLEKDTDVATWTKCAEQLRTIGKKSAGVRRTG